MLGQRRFLQSQVHFVSKDFMGQPCFISFLERAEVID